MASGERGDGSSDGASAPVVRGVDVEKDIEDDGVAKKGLTDDRNVTGGLNIEGTSEVREVNPYCIFSFPPSVWGPRYDGRHFVQRRWAMRRFRKRMSDMRQRNLAEETAKEEAVGSNDIIHDAGAVSTTSDIDTSSVTVTRDGGATTPILTDQSSPKGRHVDLHPVECQQVTENRDQPRKKFSLRREFGKFLDQAKRDRG